LSTEGTGGTLKDWAGLRFDNKEDETFNGTLHWKTTTYNKGTLFNF
jgi:hypothetical protein